MNAKLQLNRPVLIMLYGFPGCGKTYFARQLAEQIGAAHVQSDRIRFELFEEPRFDKQENDIVHHLMDYMSEEFLRAGISVIYDANALRVSQRRELRDLARRSKAQPILIWMQIDIESAFVRSNKRDRRKADDKYAEPVDQETFDRIVQTMQNPEMTEDYTVISGKHTYTTQRGAIIKRLYDLGIISTDTASNTVVKPGMVNLIPNPLAAGRVDQSRRNIIIR